jgi:hypothetical protein
LKKNPGFEWLNKISKVISGERVQDFNVSPSTVVNFTYAPMVSVDCERAFSHFKDILSSKRRKLTETHLKDIMIIQWNNSLL